MKKTAEIRTGVELISDGLKIFGVLHIPDKPTKAKFPVVLFCHGFGGNKSSKYRLAVRQAEKLSEAGIATLRIDFRGSGDSEGDFSETTIETQLEDARVAIKYLLEHPSIEPSKIALLGRSLGGSLATQLASEFALCPAVALWCPFFDAQPWIKHIKETFYFHGLPLSKECITQFSSLTSAGPLEKLKNTPMLIVHAGQDEILGSYHFQKYRDHRGDVNTEYLELSKSNHDFSDSNEQQLLLDRTTSFFRGIL